jgi:hypothetical protein
MGGISVPSMPLTTIIWRDQIVKTAKVESKKILKAAKLRRVAGVQVRSGVKAGALEFQKQFYDQWGDRGDGRPGDPGGLGGRRQI